MFSPKNYEIERFFFSEQGRCKLIFADPVSWSRFFLALICATFFKFAWKWRTPYKLILGPWWKRDRNEGFPTVLEESDALHLGLLFREVCLQCLFHERAMFHWPGSNLTPFSGREFSIFFYMKLVFIKLVLRSAVSTLSLAIQACLNFFALMHSSKRL